MSKYADPSFSYHIAAAKLWALLAAKLVEEPLIAFNATDYATNLNKYLDSVKTLVESSEHADMFNTKHTFKGLEQALAHLQNTAISFDARAAYLSTLATSTQAPRTSAKTKKLFAQIRAVNAQYKFLERAFLYPKGLDGRSWFKHVVFAPGKWTGYAGDTYPGLVEAVQAGDQEALRRWTGIIEGTVWKAVGVLRV